MQLNASSKENLNSLEGNLKSVIFGQDHAINDVVSAVKPQKQALVMMKSRSALSYSQDLQVLVKQNLPNN